MGEAAQKVDYKKLRFLDWGNDDRLPSASKGIIDASGIIHRSVLTLNLDTGEYEKLVRENGTLVVDADGDLKRVTGRMPLPIEVVWDD